jgi:hypothetical protein
MFGARFHRWIPQGPFFIHDDGGGGGGDAGDAHPEYDIDLTADDGGGGPADDPAGQQPGAPPRAPVQSPATGYPPGAGPDTRPPQYTPEQVSQVVTGYRNLLQRSQAIEAQNQLLQRQVAALTGVQPPQQQPGQQLSEADQKAIAAVYRLFPQLKPLLEKAQDILTLPDTVNTFKTEAEGRWVDLGNRMWHQFDQAVKEIYPGQLHPFAQKAIDAAFVSWLETDPQAGARYRVGDMTLPGEFLKMYRNGLVVPAMRAGNPSTPQRGLTGRQPPGQPPRVPRGGPGGNAIGQQPPQPNVKDPAAVHDAAADAYFAQQR